MRSKVLATTKFHDSTNNLTALMALIAGFAAPKAKRSRSNMSDSACANPGAWQIASALSAHFIDGRDSAAIGGDLAIAVGAANDGPMPDTAGTVALLESSLFGKQRQSFA